MNETKKKTFKRMHRTKKKLNEQQIGINHLK